MEPMPVRSCTSLSHCCDFSNLRASAQRRGPAQAWANNVTPKGIRSDIRRASAVQACRELIKDFLPIGTAPASISRRTTVALRSGLYVNAGQAAVVGNPARSMLSLMAKVRPLSGSSRESLSTRSACVITSSSGRSEIQTPSSPRSRIRWKLSRIFSRNFFISRYDCTGARPYQLAFRITKA